MVQVIYSKGVSLPAALLLMCTLHWSWSCQWLQCGQQCLQHQYQKYRLSERRCWLGRRRWHRKNKSLPRLWIIIIIFTAGGPENWGLLAGRCTVTQTSYWQLHRNVLCPNLCIKSIATILAFHLLLLLPLLFLFFDADLMLWSFAGLKRVQQLYHSICSCGWWDYHPSGVVYCSQGELVK